MNIGFTVLTLMVGVACSSKEDSKKEVPEKEAPKKEALLRKDTPKEEVPEEEIFKEALTPKKNVPVSKMRTIKAADLPTDIVVKGKLPKAIQWDDALGQNTVIFSEVHKTHNNTGFAAANNYTYLYTEVDGTSRLLRKIQDKVEQCPNDVILKFEPKALSVTDLDQDGIGEVTFAYWHDCRADLAPYGLKLLILEGQDKYIIRGRGHWKKCDPEFSNAPECIGEKKLGATLKSGPKEFKTHALKTWKRISGQTP